MIHQLNPVSQQLSRSAADQFTGSTFPIELCIHVIEETTATSALAQWAMTCRALRHKAETNLYRTVSITYDIEATLCFCKTVLLCRRRALSAKSFCLHMSHSRELNPPNKARAATFVANVALGIMRNLQALELYVVEPDLLHDVRLPILRHFATNLAVDHSLIEFIKAHAQIEELKLHYCITQRTTAAPVDLPRLRTLTTGVTSSLRDLRIFSPLTHLYLPAFALPVLQEVVELFGSTLVSLKLGSPTP
ncbi:hypothetical protein FKP32DRAFT_633596 [Trametes sanguinea]|nr:hypothetical protein FKP32DRAFT_633596 [Trametes sanguinea]